MIKYSRGRSIHMPSLYLLRETRARIAPCPRVLCVCIERNFLLSFVSPLLAIAVYMATTKDEEEKKKKKRKYDILSIIWLVDFSRVIIFAALHRYLLARLLFSLSSLLPSRFVDKRPRKERSHPIEEKKQAISSQASEGCFFLFFSSE